MASMKIQINEPMYRHTTFRTGGPADRFISVSSGAEAAEAVASCREAGEPWMIMGNGSNLLVSDAGTKCNVIHIGDDFSHIRMEGDILYAEAGARLSAVARFARDHGLTGFEFAAGIPGSTGGGVVMNAGAYGGDIGSVAVFADVLEDGEIRRIPGADMHFRYRHSAAMERKMTVLGLGIRLMPGDPAEIDARMQDLQARRTEKQPLEYPSAGSTFKRPEGYFAGKLIMDAGLAGKKVGGAMVSPKHCGFIVNYDHATSTDIYRLMKEVQDTVYRMFSVRLEPEVRLVGPFGGEDLK